MRVVMLTDDVAIDRRILQEAVTLIEDGHQVIVIGRSAASHPDHEIIDGVRIERIDDQAAGRVVAAASAFTRVSGNGINAGSRWSQLVVGRVVGRPFQFLRRFIRGWSAFSAGDGGQKPRAAERHRKAIVATERAQDRVGGLAVRAVAKGWWGVGMLNHHAVRPAVMTSARRLSGRVGLPPRDAVLADRVTYYRPDVVHAHDLPQLRAGLAAATRVGVPFVYDMHELYPEIGTLTPAQQRSLGQLERKLIGDCDATITVNPYIASEISKRYGVEEPTVILNAIDPRSESSAPERRFHQKLDLKDSDRVLLFQGWMSDTRGLDRLVRAVARTDPSVHLVLMGYGDIISELRELADVLEIGRRVHLLDAVPQAELLGWTQAADAGVIPYPAVDMNHFWCSPNKLFEFIQTNLPIVANDLPFLRDVIVGEGIGRVAPIEDERAFAAAIESVLGVGDIDSVDGLRSNLRQAAPRYSWASQEPVLRSVYRSVVPSTRVES